MKQITKILISGFLGLVLLSACAPARQSTSTPTVAPSPTAPRVYPTPASPGDSITWRGLHAGMDQVEITASYMTEFGFERQPSAAQQFVWVHVLLENVGNTTLGLPAPEHFSMLYAASEFKPSYGHRQGYPDYTTLGATLYPGQTVDAWLRFEIPEEAQLKELWFVYLPESSQVGASPSSPGYPWRTEHPLFAWVCGK